MLNTLITFADNTNPGSTSYFALTIGNGLGPYPAGPARSGIAVSDERGGVVRRVSIAFDVDRFALDLTNDNESCRSLGAKCMQVALDHLPLADRLRIALSYHPWSHDPELKQP